MFSQKQQPLSQPSIYSEKQPDSHPPRTKLQLTLPPGLRQWWDDLDRFRYEDQPLSFRTFGFITHDTFLRFIFLHFFRSLQPHEVVRRLYHPLLFAIAGTILDLLWKKVVKDKWRMRRTLGDDEAEIGLTKRSDLSDEKVNSYAVRRDKDRGVELAKSQGFNWRWWTGLEMAKKQGCGWRWYVAFLLWQIVCNGAMLLTAAWWQYRTDVREMAPFRGTHDNVSS